MAGYRCDYFLLEELVPKDVHLRYGEIAWQFFSPLALVSLDGIRKYFERKVTVNNWLWREDGFQYRGLRPPDCAVGASMSQHRFGRGFDLDVEGLHPDEVRGVIRVNASNRHFMHINCLEENVNWVHFDCRNIPGELRIMMINP